MKMPTYLKICLFVSLLLIVTTMIEAQTTVSSRNDTSITTDEIERDLEVLADCARNTRSLGTVLTMLDYINTILSVYFPEDIRDQYNQMLQWLVKNVVDGLKVINDLSLTKLGWLMYVIQ